MAVVPENSRGLSTGGGTVTGGLNIQGSYLDVFNPSFDVGIIDGTPGAVTPITLNFADGNPVLVATFVSGEHRVDVGYAGAELGFYGHATTPLQTGVAVTAAGIHAALVNLGLITA